MGVGGTGVAVGSGVTVDTAVAVKMAIASGVDVGDGVGVKVGRSAVTVGKIGLGPMLKGCCANQSQSPTSRSAGIPKTIPRIVHTMRRRLLGRERLSNAR